MGDLTASNAVIMLSIPSLFPVAQQLQGFAADDVYDIAQVQSVETRMGVDGVLSGGFVYKEMEQDIILQADSASNLFFDTWWTQMVSTQQTYLAQGLVRLAAIATKFQQTNGFLTGYKLPGAKRLIEPRRYKITWQLIQAQPG